MFGFRSDGKNAAKEMDIFTRVTPYIMPTRADAQNFNTVYFDEKTLTDYVREKRAEGHVMSTLAVVIAAYVRAIAAMPEMNRFCVGRKVYARNYLSVCFVAVHQPDRAKFEESTAKVYFTPRDTVFEVAEKVEEAFMKPSDFRFIYDEKDTVENKIAAVAREIYGAEGVDFTAAAQKQLKEIEELGFDKMPVCMAKTQYSLSDDASKLGRPTGFRITVKELRVSAGAGFLVALTGSILTMPGLPKKPAAENMDIDKDGRITGLF